MQGEIRVTVIATGFDRQIEGGLTAAAARTSSQTVSTVARTVIPITQRNPGRPTVVPRTIVPLADGAPRRVIPPSQPQARPEAELTDMDIPTFIRRQMD
jgi:cell division protein FtsZ